MFNRFATRPPPPSGQPPPYAFSRYYRYNLRPVVAVAAVAATIWALLWGASSFQNISGDKSHDLRQLVPFDITLGSLYMGVAAIEIFGLCGVLRQNLSFIRVYSPLSLVAMLLTSGAELIRIVVHFIFKHDLINECVTDVTGDTVDTDFGFFGSHSSRNLTASEAQSFCQDAWDHDTFADIVWFFVATILGLLFASVAYSYYRQLLDPSSVVSRLPQRSNNVPLNTFSSNGPYNPESAYNAGPSHPGAGTEGYPYAPPYDNAKLPSYGYTSGDDGKASKDEKDPAAVSY